MSNTRRVYETPYAGGQVEHLDVPFAIADVVEKAREAGCRVRTTICDPRVKGGPSEPHLALERVPQHIEPLLREAGFKSILECNGKRLGSWYLCTYSDEKGTV